jgi:hypothetical protein
MSIYLNRNDEEVFNCGCATFVTTACTKSESEVFYEIKSGEEFQLETISAPKRTYYCIGRNRENRIVDCISSVATEKPFIRNIEFETWSWKISVCRQETPSHAEDSLNNLPS